MEMKDVPTFTDPWSSPPKSAFLVNVLFALAKRRKAIQHQVRTIAVQKVIEGTTDDEQEKIEIELGVAGQSFRMFLWDDRWVYVDARRPRKNAGWEWEFTRQGRLVGGVNVRMLVEALKRSIDATNTQCGPALDQIWTPLLATGPRPVS